MNKSLIIIPVFLTCLSTLAFADNKPEEGKPLPNSDREITVGNPTAAESGNVADDKTVKDEKTHPDSSKDHDKNMGKAKGHDKR